VSSFWILFLLREACPWGALEKVSEPKAKIWKIFEKGLTKKNSEIIKMIHQNTKSPIIPI
jgi:hypothetical protein